MANTLSFCAGSAINIPFNISAIYNAGNTFIAQLSDSTGSFRRPSGQYWELLQVFRRTIYAVIPKTLKGNNFKVRIISTKPVYIGSASDYVFTIKPLPVVNLGNDTFSFAPAHQVKLDATYTGAASSWNTGDNTYKITVNNAGTYIVTNTNSCGSYSDTIVIKTKPFPSVNLGADTLFVCKILIKPECRK